MKLKAFTPLLVSKIMMQFAKEYHAEQLRIGGVSGSADANYDC